MILALLTTLFMELPMIMSGPEQSLSRFQAAARSCGYPPQSVVRGIFNGQRTVMLPARAPNYATIACMTKWLGSHPRLRLKQIGS
ncbi:hypothetical protein FHS94_001027 [Sphingomonas aerophila]|uniref:Uncharacterized protein n=1 Tax=Sphingomonas aerophila TaxID=1344948 RepID=A0A7W9BBM7_9SPHN|nr:hypothetical protein [Sphingomonas aerophila]